MSEAFRQLEADRQMRDAARKLIDADIRNLRGDVDEQGVGSRMALRLREGAEGVGDDLVGYVRQNPAQIGTALALGGALALGWIFRERLTQTVEKLWQGHSPASDLTIPERIAAQVRSIRD